MRGFLTNKSAEVVAQFDGAPAATRNRLGRGEALWVPSPIGLGSRIQDNYGPLIALLNQEAKASLANATFRFKTPRRNMLMKTLKSGDSYLTVIINKSAEKQHLGLSVNVSDRRPVLLYADKGGKVAGKAVTIAPEETLVVEWKVPSQASAANTLRP